MAQQNQGLKLLVITMGFIILLMSGALVGLILSKPAPSDVVAVPAFGMEGLTSADLAPRAGQDVYALNLFASWCKPCRAEMPHLMALSDKMAVYGIAFKDAPKDTQAFLAEHGNPFAQVGHDHGGMMVEALGARGLPETLIVGADGAIVYRHAGTLTPKAIERHIVPLLIGAREKNPDIAP